MPIKLVLEILKKYGLPSALAVALLGGLLWLVRVVVTDIGHKIDKLSEQVDFNSRIVDLSCQPAKPVRPSTHEGP